MKHSVLGVGLLAALCALPASSALGAFSVTRGPIWPGETDYLNGITEMTTASTLNNSGSLSYNTATLPGDTGPLWGSGSQMTGNYYWGMGVLVWGSDGATINNTGTMQGIVTGSGQAQAVGIVSLQNVTINNSGTLNGQVQNHDGCAWGVYQDSSGLNLVNNAGATISATAKFWAGGIQAAQAVRIVNNGTVTATATGGTEGDTASRAYATGIGAGCSTGYSLYFENNGTVRAICSSTTATSEAHGFNFWANGPVTLKNTGLINVTNANPNGFSRGIYFGAQGYDMTFINSGTVNDDGPSGSAVWMENDAPTGDYIINNSGTISARNSGNVFLVTNYGPPGSNHVYYTNSGTIKGGTLAFCMPVTAYESGTIHTTQYGYGSGSDVHITGLPTIDPTIEGGGTNSTLNFNLTGTLQYINGNAANGATSFSGLSGSSGSIVVSGKTYQWSNFANGVSGTATPSLANGTYKLINRNSGKALDANGAQTTNGTQIIQWTYGGGANQKWTLTRLSGSVYKIIGVQSGRSLDIYGGQTGNGTKVELWTYGGGSNQQFAFTPTDSGYYRITPQNATGSCLDVYYASTANGAVVDLWQWFGGSNPQQQWSLQAP